MFAFKIETPRQARRVELHLGSLSVYLSIYRPIVIAAPGRMQYRWRYASFGIWRGRHIVLSLLGHEAHLIWIRRED